MKSFGSPEGDKAVVCFLLFSLSYLFTHEQSNLRLDSKGLDISQNKNSFFGKQKTCSSSILNQFTQMCRDSKGNPHYSDMPELNTNP